MTATISSAAPAPGSAEIGALAARLRGPLLRPAIQGTTWHAPLGPTVSF